MNRSESIVKISAALVKAQKNMGSATKDAKNPFFKSSYADLNAIREATIPVLNAEGITVLQPTTVVDGKAFVETTLLHESGEYISSLTEIIAPKANDPQAHGSGVSYARRYGLQAFLCVGAEDDDGEKAMGRSTKPATKPVNVVDTRTGITDAQAVADQVKTYEKAKEEAPAKKSGFGVKKTTEVLTTGSEDGWS